MSQGCSVCFEGFTDQTENGPPTALPCGHIFHEICVQSWLESRRGQGEKMECPMCKQIVCAGWCGCGKCDPVYQKVFLPTTDTAPPPPNPYAEFHHLARNATILSNMLSRAQAAVAKDATRINDVEVLRKHVFDAKKMADELRGYETAVLKKAADERLLQSVNQLRGNLLSLTATLTTLRLASDSDLRTTLTAKNNELTKLRVTVAGKIKSGITSGLIPIKERLTIAQTAHEVVVHELRITKTQLEDALAVARMEGLKVTDITMDIGILRNDYRKLVKADQIKEDAQGAIVLALREEKGDLIDRVAELEEMLLKEKNKKSAGLAEMLRNEVESHQKTLASSGTPLPNTLAELLFLHQYLFPPTPFPLPTTPAEIPLPPSPKPLFSRPGLYSSGGEEPSKTNTEIEEIEEIEDLLGAVGDDEETDFLLGTTEAQTSSPSPEGPSTQEDVPPIAETEVDSSASSPSN